MNTVKVQHALLVGTAMALLFAGVALGAQQIEPQASAPAPVRELGAPEPAPEAGAQPRPAKDSAAPPHRSPLDELDDFLPPPKVSRPPAPAEVESLHALLGLPLVVTTPARIRRIAVADPKIIDTITLNQNQILINAKSLGRVTLVVEDAAGRSTKFDISVDADPLIAPVQLVKSPSGPLAWTEPQRADMAWLGWGVFGSIVLVGGVILGARRRRPPLGSEFKLEAPAPQPLEGGKESQAAAAPNQACSPENPLKEAAEGSASRLQTSSPRPERAIAERNERLLEAFLEAAVRGVFSASGGAGKGALARRLSPRSSGMPSSVANSNPLLETVAALAFAVEARGPYLKGHSQAVSRLAARIAVQTGLSAAEVEETRLAGLVHDIGKIHVPQSVCNKPERLTTEEFQMMSSHSAWGAQMLEPLQVKTIERIVRHHHERYDGKGYPDGLAGDKIPLGARIVAVAEAFHGMLSDLPYQSPSTFESALAELRRCSGIQFDPKVVAAFLDWIQIYADSAPHSKSARLRP